MKNLTAADRDSLIRLAASLPKGDESRRAILAGLRTFVAAKITLDFAEFERIANDVLSTVAKGLNKVSGMKVNDPEVLRDGRMTAGISLNHSELISVNYTPKFEHLGVEIDYISLMNLASKYKFPRGLFRQQYVQVEIDKNGRKGGEEALAVLRKDVPPELGILKGTELVPPGQADQGSPKNVSELENILMGIEAEIDENNPEVDYDYLNKWFDILQNNRDKIKSAILKLGPADAKNALKVLKEGQESIINTGYDHALNFLYELDADDEVAMEMTPYADQGDIDRAAGEIKQYKVKAEKMFQEFKSML